MRSQADAAAEVPAPVMIIVQPDHGVGHAADVLVTSVWPLAEAACGGSIPLIVRLAVEAEVRQRDWYIFASTQAEAAASGEAQGALSWPSYEQYMRTSIQALQGAAADVANPAEVVPLPADVAHADMAHADVADAAPLPDWPRSSGSEDGELEEGEVGGTPSTSLNLPVGFFWRLLMCCHTQMLLCHLSSVSGSRLSQAPRCCMLLLRVPHPGDLLVDPQTHICFCPFPVPMAFFRTNPLSRVACWG